MLVQCLTQSETGFGVWWSTLHFHKLQVACKYHVRDSETDTLCNMLIGFTIKTVAIAKPVADS